MVIFLWKNGDFPMKNGDFPLKNGDFPMKTNTLPEGFFMGIFYGNITRMGI